MKSYLVTISQGASYQPIIESVVAVSEMQAINHVILKNKPHTISFVNVCESNESTCSEDNLFDLKLKDGLYITENKPTYKDKSDIFQCTLDGHKYTFNITAIMQDLTNTAKA